jgi:hypothetical protein
MTAAEVIALAMLQSEETYDDPTWLKYINACLNDLTPIMKLLNTKSGIEAVLTNGSGSISIVGDEDLAKAASFLNVYFTPSGGPIEQLRRIPISDNTSKGWKLTQATIELQNCGSSGGTIRADFYKRLLPVTLTSDDLLSVTGLPTEYHHMVVLYCVAKSQQKEEELEDANNAYAEYQLGKKQLLYDRSWEMEPHMRRYLKRAKVAMLGGTR